VDLVNSAPEQDAAARLALALARVQHLEQENEHLRQRLGTVEGRNSLGSAALQFAGLPDVETGLSADSPSELKLALFRDLFRGRDDVYAARWERFDGRAGYSPALRQGVPRGRKIPRDPSDYLSLAPDVIRAHLTGSCTIGLYPLLRDETCWLVAIDFDKEGWHRDSLAAMDACDSLGVPAALERSRSGKGAHLWIFFMRPVAAALARNLASTILTNALDRRYQIGLDSYDRLFPSQDTLPTGGFGNLIALPLQGASRRQGNTVFLDRELEPYADQWRFLSSIKKLEPAAAESIVRQAMRAERVLAVGSAWFAPEAEEQRQPWMLPPSRRRPEGPIPGPLPDKVDIVLANRVFIDKRDLSPTLIGHLQRLAAFQNPEFYRAQAMRLSTFGKPRLIDCSEDFPEHLALPRGCLSETQDLLQSNGIKVAFKDERFPGTPILAKFQGELAEKQLEAARALARSDFGVLAAPTAFGKTVIGAWLIAQRAVNTLVLVHRQHLLDQWRERLAAFLDVPLKSIGQFGAGKHKLSGVIDVALLQSLSHKGEVKDIVANYGQVLVDECHHIPAFSFERVLGEVRAQFVVGLTATPVRKDGHHPIIAMQCGPIRLRVDAREQAENRPFEHEVVVRPTSFRLPPDCQDPKIHDLYTLLALDESRTNLVVEDVMRAIYAGRSPLVLTERTEHLERLAQKLNANVTHVVTLRGGMGARQRKLVSETLAAIPDNEPRVLLATGRYIGEGFDDARLDTLFLTLPVSWRGTIQQYAGRLHRLHPNKQLVQIFDYCDANVPMLQRMHLKRLKGYTDIGYSIARSGDDGQD
jgi:superfamily II DNA or RNA helicase